MAQVLRWSQVFIKPRCNERPGIVSLVLSTGNQCYTVLHQTFFYGLSLIIYMALVSLQLFILAVEVAFVISTHKVKA